MKSFSSFKNFKASFGKVKYQLQPRFRNNKKYYSYLGLTNPINSICFLALNPQKQILCLRTKVFTKKIIPEISGNASQYFLDLH